MKKIYNSLKLPLGRETNNPMFLEKKVRYYTKNSKPLPKLFFDCLDLQRNKSTATSVLIRALFLIHFRKTGFII